MVNSLNQPLTGYEGPVAGFWYRPGEATSALPLGWLGTGFVDFTSGATFGAAALENNWLHPDQVPSTCGFRIRIGDQALDLFPDSAGQRDSMRFWGHYPAADVTFGNTFAGVDLYLRAYSPLVPHDYELSNMPVALFHFVVTNRGNDAVPTTLILQWQAPAEPRKTTPDEGDQDASPAIDAASPQTSVSFSGQSALLTTARGSYGIGALGVGWEKRLDAPEKHVIRSEVSRAIAPDETADVVFALAWHFPQWESTEGELLRHRYATVYRDAGEVVDVGLSRAAEIERKVIEWQQTIYRSKVPSGLKDAVINGLYVLPRNSWWIDDGRFLQSESFTGCAITETLVCRFNGTFPLALLFPECERATMREFAKGQTEGGQVPFAFGTPMGTKSLLFRQTPIVSSEFALLVWRNYVLWRDDAYLAEQYPAMKAALRFAMTLDADGDGVINDGITGGQYYDVWPWWGTSAYTGSIWLAALRAGEEAAKALGDTPFAGELEQWYKRASVTFEQRLWTGEYYRLYNDPTGDRRSDTSLTNALCGQWFAYTCGLGEIVPKAHIASTIDTVLRLNAAATPYGAVNGVRPDGSIDESFADHSAVTTIGEVWNFCAMAAFAGRTEEAVRLFNESYENLALRQRTLWNIPWSLDPDTGAIKWGINYYSNTCVWTLLQALAPECYAELGQIAAKTHRRP